jgi:hypothetical protein
MGRPSVLQAEMADDGDRVLVSGTVVRLIDGSVELPG